MCLLKPHRRQVCSSGLQAQHGWTAEAGGQVKDSLVRVNSRSTQATQKEHVSRRKNIKWVATDHDKASGDTSLGWFPSYQESCLSPQLSIGPRSLGQKGQTGGSRKGERPVNQISSVTSWPGPLHIFSWIKSVSFKYLSLQKQQGQEREANCLNCLLSKKQPFVGSAGITGRRK